MIAKLPGLSAMPSWGRRRIGRRSLASLLLGLALISPCGGGSVAAEYGTGANSSNIDVMINALGLREAPVALRDTPGWKPYKKIIVKTFFPNQLEEFRAVANGATLIPVSSEKEAIKALEANKDVDAIFNILCGERTNPSVDTPELLRKAVAVRSVRWIHAMAAGIEGCANVPEARQSNILFTNMQRVNGGVMAEHVMALLLTMTRAIDRSLAMDRANMWTAAASRMIALDGKTMFIAGLGGIGEEVAQRAHAFGMRIIATRNSGHEKPDYVDYLGGPGENLKLAAEADVVVNCLPLTPETTHLFNADFFSRMPAHGYFVSVGRGESTVSKDLIAALTSHQLAGAALDVTDPEPLPPDDPLWFAPNIVITAHAAVYSDTRGRFQVITKEILRRATHGEKMLNVVDLKRGY